jgi:signal transduction histidine kinase
MYILISILFFSATINMVLAVFSARQARSTGSIELFLVLVLLSIYSFGYAFEIMADNVSGIVSWLNIEFIGISFLPAILVYFGLRYTGTGRLLKPWVEILILSFSFITLFLQITNAGGLFYKSYDVIQRGDFILARFSKGLWYWIYQAYVNIVLFSMCIIYIAVARKNTGIKRVRAVLMIIATAIPWSFYIVYIAGLSPDNIDLMPFSFTITGIIAAIGIFKFRLIDFFPVALEKIFSNIATGVIILDEDKYVIDYNNAAVKIIPELNNITGRSISEALTGYDFLSGLLLQDESSQREIQLTRNGSVEYYNVTFDIITNKNKKLLGYSLMFVDMTGRKQEEISLREANDTKTKFLALIAHDLRNPFHVMMNISELILRDAEDGNFGSTAKMAGILHNTSNNTYYLLRNLLEWAILQSRGMRPLKKALNIKELVDHSVRELDLLCRQKGIVFRHDIDSSLIVDADEQMIKTVLRNIISNAVKFSFPEGVVEIKVHEKRNEVAFEITDHGTGMTKKEQSLLFTDNTNLSKKGTLSETGTGLGLTLCREFIHLHNGAIYVKSSPKTGSVFTFTLPKNVIKSNPEYNEEESRL